MNRMSGSDASRRRRIGAASLLAALVAVLVVPGLRPAPVSGLAVVAPVAGPPHVGDCVLQRTPQITQIDSDGVPGLVALTGSCAGPHYGEVAEVIADSPPPLGSGFVDPCFSGRQIEDFLGLDRAVGPGSPWSAAISFAAFSAGPTARQKSAGQRWTACLVVVPVVQGGRSGASAIRAPYLGSVRYVAGNTLPDPFAVCSDDPDPSSAGTVDCAEPHRYQVLASAFLDKGGPSQSILQRTCRTAATSITGMWDPAAGGALTVEAKAVGFNQYGMVRPRLGSEAGQAFCVIGASTSRELRANLVGLGDAPIPWA
jgi:hypothetical protein